VARSHRSGAGRGGEGAGGLMVMLEPRPNDCGRYAANAPSITFLRGAMVSSQAA